MSIDNYFRPRSAAKRYAAGRPYFHPLTIKQIRDFISVGEKLPRALDIACGTGLSTLALKDLAIQIVGVDAATEMIEFARENDHIDFVISIAEQLSFCDCSFDLITISQAFHWLDRKRFLVEARRLLRPNAWLVVYDNYFSNQTRENDSFRTWLEDAYLAKFPSPKRPWTAFTGEEIANEGFRLVGHEQHQHTMTFSPESLIDYLVSQSNVISKVEVGGEAIADVKHWLMESISPLFAGKTVRSVLFDMPIWYMRPSS